jgi:hypothetical protein
MLFVVVIATKLGCLNSNAFLDEFSFNYLRSCYARLIIFFFSQEFCHVA